MINFVRRSSQKASSSSSHNNGDSLPSTSNSCSNNSSSTTATSVNCTTDGKLLVQHQHHSTNSSMSSCINPKITSTSLRLHDSDPEVRLEEKLRRKAFAHYDVQSITASLINASKSATLISKRRNTTTGASAASFVPSKLTTGSSKEGSTDDGTGADDVIILDDGDGKNNELVQSCPFFRNELGGEEERIICLNRVTSGQAGQSIYSGGSNSSTTGIGSSNGSGPGAYTNGLPKDKSASPPNVSMEPPMLHKPGMATGLSLLESANGLRWKIKSCPYQSLNSSSQHGANESDRYQVQGYQDPSSFVFEHIDVGARYYREHFHGLEHQNWFGIDENLGPIAISIRKERVPVIKQSSLEKNTNYNPLIMSSGDSSNTKSSHHSSNYGINHNNLTNGAGSMSKSTESRLDSRSDSKCSDKEGNTANSIKHQYRVIIRTSDLNVLRGIVYEDAVPGLSSLSSSSSSKHNHMSNHHAKEVIEYITPEITSSCLRLGTPSSDEQVIKLDEQSLNKTYKVGVLYCKYGQGSEEEMYNNEYSSRAFDDFLLMLGEKVRLKGFTKYKAGLDNKTDTTGSHCIYTQYQDNEITFHVSTLLPFTPNNRQQLLRKRHVGNDIVTIIFQEPGAKPFTPKTIRSHFQHVFIVVRLLPAETSSNHPDSSFDSSNDGSSSINSSSGTNVPFHYDPKTVRYQVAVTRSKEVPVFGPPIAFNGIYNKSSDFTEFILSKIINAENAAHRSDKFKSMAQRTRHEYLKDLAENYIASTTLSDLSFGPSAGAKLVSSLFGAGRKNRSNRGAFCGEGVVQGAIVWDLLVEDYGQNKPVDCQLGISSDTFLVLDEGSKEVIFACPNSTILGWSSHPSYIKVYFHQGEVVFLRCKDPDLDEIAEIVTRLKAVTAGSESQELILRRNSVGQLGFHFIQEGIVTDVEPYAFAWQAGLRPNFRIVEICTVAIATLDHDGIKDLLKTSMIVSVTVLPPKPDGTPRRGCPLPNCPYLTSLANGSSSDHRSGRGCEYENISGIFERTTLLGSDRRRKGQHRTVVQTKGNGSKSQPVSPDHHHHRMVEQRNSDGQTLSAASSTTAQYTQQQQRTPTQVHLTRTESTSVRGPPPASTSSSPLNSWTSDTEGAGSHVPKVPLMFDPSRPRVGSAFQPVHPQRDHHQHHHPHNFPVHRSSDLKMGPGSGLQSNLVTWHSELSLSSKTMTSSTTSLSKEDPFKYGGTPNASGHMNSSSNGQQSLLRNQHPNQSKSQMMMNTHIGMNGRPFLDSLVRDSAGHLTSPFHDRFRDGSSSVSFREHHRSPPGGGYVPMNQMANFIPGQHNPPPPNHSWTTPLPKSAVRRNGGQGPNPGHPSLSQSSGFSQQQAFGPPQLNFVHSTLGRSAGQHPALERFDSNGSRTKSPRFFPPSYGSQVPHSGQGFRPVASQGSYKSRVKSGSNKSSDSGSSSTLQEDLMKLINPEYIGAQPSSASSATNDPARQPSNSPSKGTRSSPGKSVPPPPELSPPKDVRTNQQQQLIPGRLKPSAGDIVTFAKPIVASNNSEPSSVETSPEGKALSTHRLPVLVEGSDTEWNTLVSTATKAMASLPSGLATGTKGARRGHDDSDLDTKSIGSSSPDLDESLSWLEELSTTGKKSPPSERSPGRSSEGTGRSLDGHGRTPDSIGRVQDVVRNLDPIGSRVRSPPDTRVRSPPDSRTRSPADNGPKLLSLTPSESSGRSNSSAGNLEHAVEQLQKTNASLEEEVNKLREENQRLQEESQTATAQLRKFSEWFFQNINAK